MNTLNQAIKTVTEITVQNAQEDSKIDWSIKHDASVYEASDARQEGQTMVIEAPCGALVEVSGTFATGNMHGHCRINYKVNGKRAKIADVEKLFKG